MSQDVFLLVRLQVHMAFCQTSHSGLGIYKVIRFVHICVRKTCIQHQDILHLQDSIRIIEALIDGA
jgi:hypothetical protein